jgi:hypothetical protein
MIAMVTRNHSSNLERSLKFFEKSSHSADDLWIFVDLSTEHLLVKVTGWAPSGSYVIRTATRNANAITGDIMDRFVHSDYDTLVYIDSNMVVAYVDYVRFYKFLTVLNSVKGVISIYGTASTGNYRHSDNCNEFLCQREFIDILGSVWNKADVSKILKEIPNTEEGFGLYWLEWCQQHNVTLYALRDSVVHYTSIPARREQTGIGGGSSQAFG